MVDLASMKILRWREVAPIIGCSRMTIARMEKAGTFPQRLSAACCMTYAQIEKLRAPKVMFKDLY